MSYVLGVDLGTTFSACAIGADGEVAMFQLGLRGAAIPSVVASRDDGTIVTGEAAERPGLSPSRIAREFKRRLGDPTPILVGGTPYGAEALTARLLAAILARVGEERGEAPSLVVVTHPADYGPYKRSFLEEAARLAGAEPVRFVAEPIAAAIDYEASQRVEAGELIAVYDFGGGTLDIAIVRKTAEWYELLGAPEGMARFGGSDLDQAVFGHVLASLGGTAEALDGTDPAVIAALAALREACRAAKEALSFDTDAVVPVMLPGRHTDVRITRAEFEAMIRPRVRESVALIDRAAHSAGVEVADVSRVLLVGGASRIPIVGETIRELTGRPVALDANPKNGVALGAARLGLASLERGEVPVLQAAQPQPSVAPPEQLAGAGASAAPPPDVPARSSPPAPPPAGPAASEVTQVPARSARPPDREPSRQPRGRGRALIVVSILAAAALAGVGGMFALNQGGPGVSPTPSQGRPPSQAAVTSPSPVPLVTSDRVAALYYIGFGTPAVDGGWRVWGDASRAAPPEDIAADFYPQLGPYSSADRDVIAQHMRWLARAGVGTLLLVWRNDAMPAEPLMHSVFDAAAESDLRIMIWLDVGDSKTADGKSRKLDVANAATDYLLGLFGAHPALYRPEWSPADGRAVLVIAGLAGRKGEVVPSPTAWRTFTDRQHADPRNLIVLAASGDPKWVSVANFDGLVSRGAGSPTPGDFSWSSAVPADAWYVPIVLAGRSGERSATSLPGIDRGAGGTLRGQWTAALAAGRAPNLIVIDSFNDWASGSQIEPARAEVGGLPRSYLTYDPLAPEGYLDVARSLVDRLGK